MKTKVGVVSLGCDKNRTDTEYMLAKLVEGGYEITHNPSEANVLIVNTCAFLESARREAIETALEMAHYKQDGNCQKIILTGCLGQKFGQEVFDGLTEVDAVLGAFEYDDICNVVNAVLQGDRVYQNNCQNVSKITFGNSILTTLPHTAYIKIADGCNNFCTYCLIPYIRGRYRSVEMDRIVEYAQNLANNGVKEVILVAQDTTRYGQDLYGESKIVQLVQKISQIDGIEWIRLLYCYPELMTDELIEEIATNDKVVKYVDIPLQHINDVILKRMNRRSNYNAIVNLFDKLTNRNISIRSTFICGFPGETKQTIDELEKFVLKYKLRNVGFFAYSREEGTKSYDFEDQVATRSKNSYVKRMYNAQYKVVAQLNQQDVGKIYPCIIDEQMEFDGKFYTYKGRTQFMSPDIDGIVYVSSQRPLQCGTICKVQIADAYEYDLYGELIDELTQ